MLHNPATIDALAALMRDGFVILRGAAPREVADGFAADVTARFAATPFAKGLFYGDRTKRFGRLLARSAYAEAIVTAPAVLPIVEAVLGPACDRIQLSATQAIEIHPGELAQVPHRDQDLWGGPKGAHEYLVNVMWPTSRFTAANGATLVWPGSHRRLDEALPDPAAAVAAEMEPGDALIFLGSTLHCGGANRSDAARSGVIVGYALGWLRQLENQTLSYPPEVARRFRPETQALLGYALHRPNLGHYDGCCPSRLLGGEMPDHVAATESFTEEQAAILRAYREMQRAAA